MAAIGNLQIDLIEPESCGMALKLVKPPKKSVEFRYDDMILSAEPDNPYVVFCFSGATSEKELFDIGLPLLQETLDMLCVTGGFALATKDFESKCIAWFSVDGMKKAIHNVSFYQAMQGGISARMDEFNKPYTQSLDRQAHKVGYRYLRLAEISEDLFEAYRNLYLAFENLISIKYPKGGIISGECVPKKISEKNWLKQSLTSSFDEFGLSQFSTEDSSAKDTVNHIVKTILKARTSLFHAKEGRGGSIPCDNNLSDRKLIKISYQMLTKLVGLICSSWCLVDIKPNLGNAWLNPSIFNETKVDLFNQSYFMLCEHDYSTQNEIVPSLHSTLKLDLHVDVPNKDEMRVNITGMSREPSQLKGMSVYSVCIMNDDVVQLAYTLGVNINLDEFDKFEVHIEWTAEVNATEKRYFVR